MATEKVLENSPDGLFNQLQGEWNDIRLEFYDLQETHKEYSELHEKLNNVQKKELLASKKLYKRLMNLRDKIRKAQTTITPDSDDKSDITAILTDLNLIDVEISEVKTRMSDLKEQLPQENNGVYLNVILGQSVDVSLLNKERRYNYKLEYEKFKLILTAITTVVALLTFLVDARFLDAILHFLLVWYYCTLTIRESILRVNGSRMKGWWVAHHYIAAVFCGVMITWPDGECYRAFRKQFIAFTFYLALVQLMQGFYQRGCLYRLRALGVRDQMDITIEGFHAWMFKGLTFLLPFLFAGYAFQFYNMATLLSLQYYKDCPDWQVIALGLTSLLLACGNTYTTLRVVGQKLANRNKSSKRLRLQTKYSIAGGDKKDE